MCFLLVFAENQSKVCSWAVSCKHIRSDAFGEHKFTISIRVRRSALAPRWPDACPTLARRWPDTHFLGPTLARRWPDAGPTLILRWPATFVSWLQFWIFIINISRRTRPNMFSTRNEWKNKFFWEHEQILIDKHVFLRFFIAFDLSCGFLVILIVFFKWFHWFLRISRFLKHILNYF